MEYASVRDCWNLSGKYGRKVGYATSLVIIIFILWLPSAVVYLVSFFGESSLRDISAYLSLSCWSLFLILLALLIYMGRLRVKYDPNRMFIRCISQYYDILKENEEFEDFRGFIDSGQIAVIEFDWVKWLIIPDDEKLMVLTHVSTKYTDFHIRTKMREFTLFSKGSKSGTYPPVIFATLTCDDTQYGSSLSFYKGICYLCSSDETCALAKELIDGIKRNPRICGVSLGGVYSGRYLGICAKIPKSREEFESLLSYASDLRSMLADVGE